MRKGSVVMPPWLGFFTMAAFTSLILLGSLYFYARQLYFNFEDILQSLDDKLVAARLQSSLLEARWAADRYLASGDPAHRAQAEKAREQAERYRGILLESVEKAEQDTLSAKYQVYDALLDGMLYYSSETGDPQAYEGQVDAALDDLLESTTTIYERAHEQVKTDLERYSDFFQNGYRIAAIAGGALIFLGAATGLALARRFVTAPLESNSPKPGGGWEAAI
jgi:hypothetical protein